MPQSFSPAVLAASLPMLGELSAVTAQLSWAFGSADSARIIAPPMRPSAPKIPMSNILLIRAM